MHRLGIFADLLDGVVLAPPDVEVILREIRRVVRLERDLELVPGLLDRDDLHLAPVDRTGVGHVLGHGDGRHQAKCGGAAKKCTEELS